MLENPMNTNMRQLVLSKGCEKYIFRYADGCEDELLDALVSQARQPRTSFDWFDAAVLSFKLSHFLISQADRIMQTGNDCQTESKAEI